VNRPSFRVLRNTGIACFFAAALFAVTAPLPKHRRSYKWRCSRHRGFQSRPLRQAGDDFYRYANGGMDRPHADSRGSRGIGVFSSSPTAAAKNVAPSSKRLRSPARRPAPTPAKSRPLQRLYGRGRDRSPRHEAAEPHLAEIAAIHDQHDLALALGKTLRAESTCSITRSFPRRISSASGSLLASPTPTITFRICCRAGSKMPSRDYYLNDRDRMRDVRAKYAVHVAAMIRLAGSTMPRPGPRASSRSSTPSPETHISLADIEDIAKANNLWQRTDFAAKAPGLDWDAYFAGAGLTPQQQFMVWTPTALAGESALVASTPIDTWKDWLTFHLIENYAAVLPRAVADEQFSFGGKVLSGVPQQRPRWQLGVGLVNACLGDAVRPNLRAKILPS